jgi:hypothetical protein
MKIRNLRLYFAKYFGKDLSSEIGNENDLLYGKLVNSNLQARVGDLVSFAVNPTMQVFYEMVQNAHDAEATRISFYYSKEYFIVVNNGNPLNTDLPNENGESPSGQLVSFLAKGFGEKFGNTNLIGKHGIGSKLLYFLLTPRSNATESGIETKTADKLIDTIIHQLKGPIVFSWKGLNKLEEFLFSPFSSVKPSDSFSTDDPQLFKVVYSYYPAFPGESKLTRSNTLEELFNEADYEGLKSALIEIEPYFQKTSFSQGTLIYVPLGDGQYDQLEEIVNSHVNYGIKGSLTFIKRLNSVTVNKEKFNATPYHRKEFEINTGSGSTEKLVFAFPTSESELDASIPNFYNYFPIAKTDYGLNYILSSSIYETDQSRQNLDLHKEVNKTNLRVISEKIITYINNIGASEVSQYIDFIRCILNSNQERLKGEELINELFFHNILSAISAKVPTSINDFRSHQFVYAKLSVLEIPSKLLGIDGCGWLHSDLTPFVDLCVDLLGVKLRLLPEIVQEISKHAEYQNWIWSLSEDKYHQLLRELINENRGQELSNLPVIKFSDHSLRPLNDIRTNKDLIFLFNKIELLLPVLKKNGFIHGLDIIDSVINVENLSGNSQEEDAVLQLKKMTERLNNSYLLDITDKWIIFDVFSQFEALSEELESLLRIFENRVGEKKPLNRLYHDAIEDAPSGILNSYELRASEKYYQKLDRWLLNKTTIWEVLLLEWNEVVKPNLNVLNFERIVSDLNNFFESSLTRKKLNKGQDWIPISEGIWSSSQQVFFTNNSSSSIFTNQHEYENLSDFIEHSTRLFCIPGSFLPTLAQVYWVDWSDLNLEFIENNFKEDDDFQSISEIQLELLLQLPRERTSFFDSFVIKEENNELYIAPAKGRKQFYLENDIELVNFLMEKGNYVHLPSSARKYFDIENENKLRKKNEAFALELIQVFGCQPEFIDIVQVSQNSSNAYLQILPSLELFSDDGPDKYHNTLVEKLIMLISKPDFNHYKAKIRINSKSIFQYTYKQNVLLKIDSKDYEFRLSDLWPEQRENLKNLEKVRDKCYGFTKEFDRLLDDKELTDFSRIEEEIKLNGVKNLTQFCFYIAWKKHSPTRKFLDEISYSQDLKLEMVLEQLYQKKITFYRDYLVDRFKELDVSRKFITNSPDLILEEERLPQWIQNWYERGVDGKKKSFLISAGLNDTTSSLLAFRTQFPNQSIIDPAIQEKPWFLENTLKWIFEKRTDPVSLNSPVFSLVNIITAFLVKQPNWLPSFLWSLTPEEDDSPYFILKPTTPKSEDKVYSDKISDHTITVWKDIIRSTELTLYYIDMPGITPKLMQLGIKECTFIETFNDVSRPSIEWTNQIYQNWKAKHGDQLSILIVEEPISVNLSIEIGDNKLRQEIGAWGNKAAERSNSVEGKPKIYVHSTLEDDGKIIDTLFENRSSLLKSNDEQELLLELQNGIVKKSGSFEFNPSETSVKHSRITEEQLEQLDSYFDILDSLIQFAPTIKSIDQLTLSRLSENIQTISSLLRVADSELLESIFNNLDWIKEELESERKEPTPEALVGYIGERLVYHWLLKQGKQCKYVAATVPEYDIEFMANQKEIKVDVKSTVKTIRNSSESIPFFVKKSQYKYTQSNPEIDYYIVRLSLPDINIDKLYTEYKLKGTDFNSIIESYREEIDAKIVDYLNSADNIELFKQNRSIIRLNLGRKEVDIFENPELL